MKYEDPVSIKTLKVDRIQKGCHIFYVYTTNFSEDNKKHLIEQLLQKRLESITKLSNELKNEYDKIKQSNIDNIKIDATENKMLEGTLWNKLLEH